MNLSTLLLVLFSITEILLLGVVVMFFLRLKKSESLLEKLSQSQEAFVNKLHFNAQLEQEMVQTFTKRQQELFALDEAMEKRAAELSKLVKQADIFLDSPALKRETIKAGNRQGKSPLELAKTTGLTLEEVELIIDQDS